MTVKIWKVSEIDWVAAETGKAAFEWAANEQQWGEWDRQQETEAGYPVEVDDADMDKLTILCDRWDQERGEWSERLTFRAELQRMIDNGDTFPFFFASTEY